LLIKDILDTLPKVSLFTRPRRFGKTLNMDMLRVFFEKTDEDNSIYFKDKKIWACGEKYQSYQGKYPVIYLSFKDVKFETWEQTFEKLKTIFRDEFSRHANILASDQFPQPDREYFNKIVLGNPTEVDLTDALYKLSAMLCAYYHTQTIIIIDEYDTPIQQGYTKKFYDEIILFMRNLFSGGFKDNSNLAFGFLTGILRVAKESIFSGMNNLKENSILTDRFGEYFGFTKKETLDILSYYGHRDKWQEVTDWYDGYLFGKTEIFNPWSVINYLDESCTPKAYWQFTGNNEIIREIVSCATYEIQEKLQLLLQGESVLADIDSSVIYPEIKNNTRSIFSFLLIAGYLKVVDRSLNYGNNFCYVAIPNNEIRTIYGNEILSSLPYESGQSSAVAIQQAIIQNDIQKLKTELEKYLLETVSFHDTATEGFYHGLMLGFYGIMNNLYRITSNRESGEGRYDISMEPIYDGKPAIIVELKVLKDDSDNKEIITKKLKVLSQEALAQINNKSYDASFKTKGIKNILKIGIAFHKKQAEISCLIEQ
jgi:hypothetical protein